MKCQPRIIAHRGASGQFAENSLSAFREAIRGGADGIELDVHVAATGELVVHHDPLLEGLGPIAGLGLAAIRAVRLSNSEGIPSLGEALEAIFDAARGKANPEVWIELKALPESADQTLLAVIDRSAIPESCGVHSFDHRIVARIGRKRPALRRGILSASYPVDPVAPMRAAGARVLWQEWHLIDAALVTMVHQAGGQIVAWTVNEVETARRLARIGVDALCGNWPERLRAE